jgi:FrmR/RcnR family transcriptional regulator, repressor of frmRAB operon
VLHRAREKSKILNRVRRIRGQIEAVGRAVDQEISCADVMQLIAACPRRHQWVDGGSDGGSHSDACVDPGPNPNSERAQATEELIDVVRSYLK